MSYWRGNPIYFMLAAGCGLMAGLYAPSALQGLNRELGYGIGLMLIMYAFLNVGLAMVNCFKGAEN